MNFFSFLVLLGILVFLIKPITSEDVCPNNLTCFNEGTCQLIDIGNYTCNCPIGYSGSSCEITPNACIEDLSGNSRNPRCDNGGTCVNFGLSYKCDCSNVDYTGSFCEVRISNCNFNSCQNGGVCIDGLRNYTCDCSDTNYSGFYCEQKINFCASNPCKNNSTCIDLETGYLCECDNKTSNGTDCENLINYCDIFQNPCKNQGTCVPTAGDYTCLCESDSGYTGKNCTDLIDFCTDDSCQNGGICKKKFKNFECDCSNTLFFGKSCTIPKQPCIPNPCSNEADCYVNQQKEEICLCPNSFEGTLCEIQSNSNPCRSNPCLGEHSQCLIMKTPNSNYFCKCEEGRTGKNCEADVSTPSLAQPDPCLPGGWGYVINENPTKLKCACNDGQRGPLCSFNTTKCDDFAIETGFINCGFFGECILNKITKYPSCKCKNGYTGHDCKTEENTCYPNPCQNGGTCLFPSGKCECKFPFVGRYCESTIDQCIDKNCLNSGLCRIIILTRQKIIINHCDCPFPFFGEYCENILS